MRFKKGTERSQSNKPEFSRGQQNLRKRCPYYVELWNECKKLWNNNKIYSYFTVNGTVRIKQVENGLRVLFPEKQSSTS